jgi:hypothetical protein
MSAVTPTSGPSFSGFIAWFFIGFAVLYSMWYFSGGPQKESSNNAFIEQPTYQNPNANTTYGTIEQLDRLNRQQAE